MSKKMMSMLLTLLFTCLTFFGLGEFGLFHWEDCCFVSVITVNPALVTSDNPEQEGCIVRGDLTKLLADVDTLLLLINCQNPGHKVRGDRMHAQFNIQNSLSCPITNSDLISKVLNGSTSILTNELLKLGNRVWRCAADGPACVLVVLNGCPASPELSMPFKH
jgi:hypothetical protein